MPTLVYNNVALPYPLSSQFTQEAVYDDTPGGSPTDWTCMKFDIGVQCLINSSYLALLAPDLIVNGQPTTNNAADIMSVIRSRLMQPRKSLSMKFNSRELLPRKLPTNTGFVDARNGPMPQSCVITQMHNTTFLLTYRIVAHYWENNKVTPGGNPLIVNRPTSIVLSNRWTESVEMNECMMSTRTREGKFMIRSDNAQGQIADEVRSQMAVVSIPEGFLRTSHRYSQSSDGLSLSYTLVDKEVFKMPPEPAFDAEGDYSESCNRLGVVRYADCRVILKGAKTTAQDQLVLAAIAVAVSKLKINGAGIIPAAGETKANGILDSFNVRAWLYENKVECAIRAQFRRNKRTLFGTPGTRANFVATPLSDDVTVTPPYRDRGSANLLLQAAAYYDPNIFNNKLVNAPITSEQNLRTTIGDRQVQTQGGKIPGRAGADGE